MEYVLKTNALSKKYRDFKALDSFSMNIPKGAIYGFVGKNGAGKTTLMKIAADIYRADAGREKPRL